MRKYVLVASLPVLAIACAAKTSSPVSTIEGTVDVSSFQQSPTGVDAIDESGTRTHAVFSPSGAFKLGLLKGHHYHLVVLSGGNDVPLAMRRSGGRLDAGFRVSSGAAHVSLGAVTELARGSATQLRAITAPSIQENANDESCDDGADPNPSDGETNDDSADSLSSGGEVAVSERNAPEDVSGCNDGEEEDDGTND